MTSTQKFSVRLLEPPDTYCSWSNEYPKNPRPSQIASCFRETRYYTKVTGFPGGSAGREPARQCRRHKRCGFDAWVRKIPWRRKWQPTSVFLPGKSHGQRSLTGYSLWGRKESDMTECSHTHTYTHIHAHAHTHRHTHTETHTQRHTHTETHRHTHTHWQTHTQTHTHGLARSKPKSYMQFKELCEDSLPKTPHPLTLSCMHMHLSTAFKQILELYRFRTSHVLQEWTSSRKVFTSQPCNCKDE